MAVEKIEISAFLQKAATCPLLDVRSPGEFAHAHIPGAFSMPLFTDEERKVVGTTYKQQSREDAIKVGLDFYGPKMRTVVETVEGLLRNKATSVNGEPSKTVLVHCWRGGMRSAAIAWLLDLYGFRVFSLDGGYKQFRNYVLKAFEQPYLLHVVGGYTGSGKTHVIRELARHGRSVIDLEKIANHRGSTFGAIGQPPQPSQEMFENILALELNRAVAYTSGKTLTDIEEQVSSPIWIEDESQRIGSVNIPQPFWSTMRNNQVFFLDLPFEQRLNHIVEEYGKLDTEKMINGIMRIKKRLGGWKQGTLLTTS